MCLELIDLFFCFDLYGFVEVVIVGCYCVVEYEVLLYYQFELVGDVVECVVEIIVVVLYVDYVYVGIVCVGQYLCDLVFGYLCWEYVEWDQVCVFGEDWYVVDDKCEVVIVCVGVMLQFDGVQVGVVCCVVVVGD